MTVDDTHSNVKAAVESLNGVPAADLNESERVVFYEALHALHRLDETMAERTQLTPTSVGYDENTHDVPALGDG